MDLPSMIKKNELINKDGGLAKRQKGPKVKFKDKELHVTIGQWMEMLVSRESRGGGGVTMITHLAASTLLREGVSFTKLNEVSKAFGELLVTIGVPENETCIFENFNSNKGTFTCHFKNMNEDAKMQITWGSMLDDLPGLIVEYRNVKRVYDYHIEQESCPRRLVLSHFTAKNPMNGNEVYCFMSPFSANFTVSNGNKGLEVKVNRPEHIKELFDYTFRLEDDASLAEYLLDETLPASADQVFKELYKHLDLNEVYPLVMVKAYDKEDNKEYITDKIAVRNGELEDFILTRMGKKVGFDANGNIIYENKGVSVSKDKDGKVDYHLSVDANTDLSSLGSLKEHVDLAEKEVEEIRTLAKTLTSESLIGDKNE